MQNKLFTVILYVISIFYVGCNVKDDKTQLKDSNLIDTTKYVADTTKANGIIEVVLTIYGGDHEYVLIIGSDTTEVINKYNASSTYKDSFSKSFDIHKHLLSQKAIDHIWQYVQNHCTPSEGKLADGEYYYNIGKVSSTPLYKTGCRIESKELGIKYFTGLIKWIQLSPYSEECRYFIGDIKGKFIDGGPFPLTPNQQRTLDSIHNRKVR